MVKAGAWISSQKAVCFLNLPFTCKGVRNSLLFRYSTKEDIRWLSICKTSSYSSEFSSCKRSSSCHIDWATRSSLFPGRGGLEKFDWDIGRCRLKLLHSNVRFPHRKHMSFALGSRQPEIRK